MNFDTPNVPQQALAPEPPKKPTASADAILSLYNAPPVHSYPGMQQQPGMMPLYPGMQQQPMYGGMQPGGYVHSPSPNYGNKNFYLTVICM